MDPVIIRNYPGRTQEDASYAFAADAARLGLAGYVPVSQSWADGRPGVGRVLALGLFANQLRPDGVLTVTYHFRPEATVGHAGAAPGPIIASSRPAPTPPETAGEALATASNDNKACPDCAEVIQVAARICRYCRYEFWGAGEEPPVVETLLVDEAAERPSGDPVDVVPTVEGVPAPPLELPPGEWRVAFGYRPSGRFLVKAAIPKSPGRSSVMVKTWLAGRAGEEVAIGPRTDGDLRVTFASGWIMLSQNGFDWATCPAYPDLVAAVVRQQEVVAILRKC